MPRTSGQEAAVTWEDPEEGLHGVPLRHTSGYHWAEGGADLHPGFLFPCAGVDPRDVPSAPSATRRHALLSRQDRCLTPGPGGGGRGTWRWCGFRSAQQPSDSQHQLRGPKAPDRKPRHGGTSHWGAGSLCLPGPGTSLRSGSLGARGALKAQESERPDAAASGRVRSSEPPALLPSPGLGCSALLEEEHFQRPLPGHAHVCRGQDPEALASPPPGTPRMRAMVGSPKGSYSRERRGC